MEDARTLLQFANLIGRHAGTCTTFERAAAAWRDGDNTYIGVSLESLTRFGDAVLAPSP